MRYFAAGGTLLGAVRHKGFIPWDDDIDLLMPWEDYKTFLQVAQSELVAPFFLQSMYSEEEGSEQCSRLRNSDTTGCTQWELENVTWTFNRGIFIDIFPLFYVPDSTLAYAAMKGKLFFYTLLFAGRGEKRRKNKRLSRLPMVWLWNVFSRFSDHKALQEDYLRTCARVTKKSRKMGILSYSRKKNLVWDADIFDEAIDLPFENTTIRCPRQFDKYLTIQYGDWKTPVRGGAKHQMAVIDPEHSYLQTLNQEETK